MLEQLMTFLHFAARQRTAMYEALDMLKKLITFKIPFKSILATMLTVLELFSAAFSDTPVHPYKDPIDLTGYEIVFEDEFDGDSLDMDKWYIRGEGYRGTTILSDSQIYVEDGLLKMRAEYLENGKYGPGWYRAAICARPQFLRGYFEIKCKVLANTSNPQDMWSAFWMCNSGCYDHDISQGGVYAVELDIMEAFTSNPYTGAKPTSVVHALWCNGVDDDRENVDGRNFGKFFANNPTEEFNTYGLLWTEDEYVWYINGIETVRSSYVNGVCVKPEELIVSISGPSYDIVKDKSIKGDYTIDYVRVWQLPTDEIINP